MYKKTYYELTMSYVYYSCRAQTGMYEPCTPSSEQDLASEKMKANGSSKEKKA